VAIPAGDVAPDDYDAMNGFLHLTLSSRETDRLLAYQEAAYTQPPPVAPPVAGVLWSAPVSYFAPDLQPHREEAREAHDRIAATHPASALLHTGTRVVGRDGTKVGTVQELIADKRTGRLAQLVARRGRLDETEVRIPVQLIDFVTADTIYVALDKGRVDQFTYP
jgi:sporulation protein YlmC with PRC-barrel domain